MSYKERVLAKKSNMRFPAEKKMFLHYFSLFLNLKFMFEFFTFFLFLLLLKEYDPDGRLNILNLISFTKKSTSFQYCWKQYVRNKEHDLYLYCFIVIVIGSKKNIVKIKNNWCEMWLRLTAIWQLSDNHVVFKQNSKTK